MSWNTAADNIIMSLRLAWFNTKAILFSPFNLKKWLMYGLLSYLALGGGGVKFNFPTSGPSSPSIPSGASQYSPSLMILLIVVVISVILLIVLLFMWLQSHSQFILMKACLKKKIEIKDYWAFERQRGHNYLWWLIGITLLMLLIVAIAVFAVIFSVVPFSAVFASLSLSGSPLKNNLILSLVLAAIAICVLAAIIMFFFFAVFLIITLYIAMVNCFVLPCTLKMDKGIKITEAVKMLFPSIKQEWKAVILFMFATLIISGILQVIIFVVICVVGMIIFIPYIAICFFIGALMVAQFTAASKLFIAFAVIAILVGCALALLVVLAIYPIIGVFIKTFHMSFASKLLPEYAIIEPKLDNRGNIIGFSSIYDEAEQPQEIEESYTSDEPYTFGER